MLKEHEYKMFRIKKGDSYDRAFSREQGKAKKAFAKHEALESKRKEKYEHQPSSLVPGKTKGQLHKEIMSGKYYDEHHSEGKIAKSRIMEGRAHYKEGRSKDFKLA